VKKVWYWDRYSARWKLMHIATDMAFLTADEVALIWAGSEYVVGAPIVVSDTEPS